MTIIVCEKCAKKYNVRDEYLKEKASSKKLFYLKCNSCNYRFEMKIDELIKQEEKTLEEKKSNARMRIIQQNPFRILALPVAASERDIAKRINELSTFAEFGKTKDYHTDFNFISPINRSVEDIEEAAKAIELPEKKLYHSLFWFWNHNSIDDLVFDILKDGDTQKAITLWRKTVPDAVNVKNYSNAHNLSLLYLILSIGRNTISPEMFFAGLDISCKILSHEELGTYSENIAIGTNFSGIQHKIQKFYIDQILHISADLLRMGSGIEAKKILNCFQSLPMDSYHYASGRFLNKPIYEIETAVDATTNIRKAEPSQSYIAGIKLVKNTKDNLSFLREVLSQGDVQYQLVTDKIVNELLNCSTDFFNDQVKVDRTLLPHESAKELSQHASSIAVGSRTKNKVSEDLSLIDKLIEDKKAGDKIAEIEKHFSEIFSRIKKLPDPESISSIAFKNLPAEAKQLVNSCKFHLDSIKKILGKDDEYYLVACNSVVNSALGMCIVFANKLKEYEKPIEVLNVLVALDMSSELRERLLKNKSILSQNRINEIISTSAPPKKSGGCYIATMVYGDYDVPEVKILRQYRDNVLAKYIAGKLFIKVYYRTSPMFVRIFGNNKLVKHGIRRILSKIIEGLTK